MDRSSHCSYPYFDPSYETLIARINPPRVIVENTTCEKTTLIKVDSANTQGVLLEVVQLFTELDLSVSKAYISSDGDWFMDVFHVTDQENQKVTDNLTIEFIKRSLGARLDDRLCNQARYRSSSGKCLGSGKHVKLPLVEEHTAIELFGTDRPGLLSEISAVLTVLGCNVKHANVWTHNLGVACVVDVTEGDTGSSVKDEEKLARILEQLCSLMGVDDHKGARISFDNTNRGRRLHQMMFADFERMGSLVTGKEGAEGKPKITITTCKDKGYTIVNVESSDRPKLLFDTVCTLTDMQHNVYHATINSEKGFASQEYYILDGQGKVLDSDLDKQRVIKGLEAAIERRCSDGLRLELCMSDRIGLLSEVTRKFRENGLSVTRADVQTRDNQAVNVFYVTDIYGNPVEKRIIDSIQKDMNTGSAVLKVIEIPRLSHSPPNEPAKGWKGFSFGSLWKLQSEKLIDIIGLGSLGWARSR